MGFLYRKFVGGEETELEDVIRNVRYLLSTKRGAGSFLRGFGVSETGYRTPEEMMLGMGEEIRECLRLYEPRVELIDIEEDYGENKRVRLNVQVRLKQSGEMLRILMDPRENMVQVSPGGKSKRKK